MRPDLTTPAPSDAELLRLFVRQRDDAAFGRLVGRHMRAVRHVAYRYTHHHQAAEDVAQAAFLVMAQRPRQAMRSAKWKRSALPWLAKVARYAAANWRRAEERRHRHETRAAAHEPAHYDPTAGVELAEAVRSALACLPRRDRRIVEWRHLSQMPWDEVARQAGTTPEAARKAGTRALSQLRTILERRGVTAGVGVIGATLAALSRPAAALSAPLAIELARKVILMARIKTASALTAVAATVFIGGAIVSNATGGQENGLTTSQPGQQAAATQGGSSSQPLRIPLAGETTLEVVAISDGEKFWTADGVRLDEPAFEVPDVNVPDREGLRLIYIKLAIAGAIEGGELPPGVEGTMNGGWDERIRGGEMIDGGIFIPVDQDGRSVVLCKRLTDGAKATRLSLYVAADPWRTQQLNMHSDALNGLRTFSPVSGIPVGTVLLSPYSAVPTPPAGGGLGTPVEAAGTQITISSNQRTTDVHPIFRDADGKWHASRGGTYSMGDEFFVRTYVSDIAASDVQSVALLTRGVFAVDLDVPTVPEPQPEGRMRRVVKPPPRVVPS